MAPDDSMCVTLSSRWAERLRALHETGMGYQIVSVQLHDGRRFERVPGAGGFLDLSSLSGFWKAPFAEPDISDIVVTHDRSGSARLAERETGDNV